jgi:hypothetical protein
MSTPGYWMNEETGVLRPAIEAYLRDEPMTGEQIAAMRLYLRQWINAPVWSGPEIGPLRRAIDGLTTKDAIGQWLNDADDAGMDPL